MTTLDLRNTPLFQEIAREPSLIGREITQQKQRKTFYYLKSMEVILKWISQRKEGEARDYYFSEGLHANFPYGFCIIHLYRPQTYFHPKIYCVILCDLQNTITECKSSILRFNKKAKCRSDQNAVYSISTYSLQLKSYFEYSKTGLYFKLDVFH